MTRAQAIDVIAAARSDAFVITGPGANSGLLYERGDAPATIYNMDMGYATAVALGVALACQRRPVLAIEGEGSFLCGSNRTVHDLAAEAGKPRCPGDRQRGVGHGRRPGADRDGIRSRSCPPCQRLRMGSAARALCADDGRTGASPGFRTP